MNISYSDALAAAKEIYSDYQICSCTELNESWVFFVNSKNKKDFVVIPPLEILKSGEDIRNWKRPKDIKSFGGMIDWLKDNGTEIPVD